MCGVCEANSQAFRRKATFPLYGKPHGVADILGNEQGGRTGIHNGAYGGSPHLLICDTAAPRIAYITGVGQGNFFMYHSHIGKPP
jgi:hypothetical protein